MIILQTTEREWAILEHRLGVPDSIADVLSYEYGHNRDKVEQVVEILRQKKWDEANNISPEIVREVLKDCIEGSTYFCDIDDAVEIGEISRGDMLADFRAGHSLVEKVSEAIGEKVELDMT